MGDLLDIYSLIKEEEQQIELQKYTIFCDMDGVIADFDERFDYFAGISPKAYESQYGKKKFWNLINDAGAGFSYDTNKISIFEKNGKETHYELKTKTDVARDIVEKIIELLG